MSNPSDSGMCSQKELVLRYEENPGEYRWLAGREIFNDPEIESSCNTTISDECDFYTTSNDHGNANAMCDKYKWKWVTSYWDNGTNVKNYSDIGTIPLYYCMVDEMKSVIKQKNGDIVEVYGTEVEDYGFTITGWNPNTTSREYVLNWDTLHLTSPDYSDGSARCLGGAWSYYHPCEPWCGPGSTMTSWRNDPLMMSYKPPCSFLSYTLTVQRKSNFMGSYIRQYPLYFNIVGCRYMAKRPLIEGGSTCQINLEGYKPTTLKCADGQIDPYFGYMEQGSSEPAPLRRCDSSKLMLTINFLNRTETIPVMESIFPLYCSSPKLACSVGFHELTCINEDQWWPSPNIIVRETDITLSWDGEMSAADMKRAGEIIRDEILVSSVPMFLECKNCTGGKQSVYSGFFTTNDTSETLSDLVWASRDSFSFFSRSLVKPTGSIPVTVNDNSDMDTLYDSPHEGSVFASFSALLLLLHFVAMIVFV
eukprot:TRINITY_DN1802_c2_g1_i3.p1 TRINITY_DN1802_c2_g1~~TRINITY_DN1802_c2_g1_i3.p1  ORF type:complete len:478 (+),score=81.11 TRINITY_DN1802_c2_g1_i3:45-1478(+)